VNGSAKLCQDWQRRIIDKMLECAEKLALQAHQAEYEEDMSSLPAIKVVDVATVRECSLLHLCWVFVSYSVSRSRSVMNMCKISLKK